MDAPEDFFVRQGPAQVVMDQTVKNARSNCCRLTKRRVVGLVLALVALPPVLFAINGLVLANNERPISGTTSHAAALQKPYLPICCFFAHAPIGLNCDDLR